MFTGPTRLKLLATINMAYVVKPDQTDLLLSGGDIFDLMVCRLDEAIASPARRYRNVFATFIHLYSNSTLYFFEILAGTTWLKL